MQLLIHYPFLCLCSLWPLREIGLRASSLQLLLDWVGISPIFAWILLLPGARTKPLECLKLWGVSRTLPCKRTDAALLWLHEVFLAVSPVWQTGLKKLLLQGGSGWSDSRVGIILPTISPKWTALVASRAGRRGGREGRWWKLPRAELLNSLNSLWYIQAQVNLAMRALFCLMTAPSKTSQTFVFLCAASHATTQHQQIQAPHFLSTALWGNIVTMSCSSSLA